MQLTSKLRFAVIFAGAGALALTGLTACSSGGDTKGGDRVLLANR